MNYARKRNIKGIAGKRTIPRRRIPRSGGGGEKRICTWLEARRRQNPWTGLIPGTVARIETSPTGSQIAIVVGPGGSYERYNLNYYRISTEEVRSV